ncbi:4-coumarate-CoA ligase [Microthyrium microscopicum]|uniref:4-coumarate-CoA ligase n=1 Tax=Microthyrium microscopicum TaxID=703497 RepID=A0A6A6UAQ2_9PEZI|nr:4-coumarate-CoA ligase [Microthyrium microscopicum]
MPILPKFPHIDIPKSNLLEYLFPEGSRLSEEPLWIDSSNPSNCLSPKQAVSWTKRMAIGLDRLGVKSQEVVMILSPNHIFVPIAYLGIVGSTRIFSAGNPIYTVPELAYQMNNTGAKALFVHPTMVETALAAAQKAGLPRERIYLFSDRPSRPIDGIKDWRELIGTPEEARKYKWKTLYPEEAMKTIATINYSSGTTGLPKGVMISHANIIANAEQTMLIKFWDTGYDRTNHPPERNIGFLPLYHAYGQMWSMVLTVKMNIPNYIMEKFQFEEFLRVISTYKITNLQVAPPILVMLSKRPETAKFDISSVTHALCGAAPLSKELQNDITKRFGIRVTQGWGMTENTNGALFVPFKEHDNTGSVGRLVSNMECKLLDDDGKEVEVGQPGEIFVRGPNICLGYWKNEEATKETLDAHGWLKTGDIAVIDKEQRFWIVDRKKELIKVNALQVAPAELEAVLLEHELISDAAVVGITIHSEEWPRAYIVLKPEAYDKITYDDIHVYMNSKVAKHKQLVGGILFIDEVPKLASGKIVRKQMKEWAKRDAAMLEGYVRARI